MGETRETKGEEGNVWANGGGDWILDAPPRGDERRMTGKGEGERVGEWEAAGSTHGDRVWLAEVQNYPYAVMETTVEPPRTASQDRRFALSHRDTYPLSPTSGPCETQDPPFRDVS